MGIKINRDEQIIQQLRELFPDVEWDKLEEADRALNWDLYWGPLPYDYWTEAEPLEHYEWRGQIQAMKDIPEMLDPLPPEIWWDAWTDCIEISDPELNDDNNDEETGDWIG